MIIISVLSTCYKYLQVWKYIVNLALPLKNIGTIWGLALLSQLKIYLILLK